MPELSFVWVVSQTRFVSTQMAQGFPRGRKREESGIWMNLRQACECELLANSDHVLNPGMIRRRFDGRGLKSPLSFDLGSFSITEYHYNTAPPCADVLSTS